MPSPEDARHREGLLKDSTGISRCGQRAQDYLLLLFVHGTCKGSLVP